MHNLVIINGKEVERIEYKNQPVVTLKMVDELHERPANTAKRNFNYNKKQLVENEDYFKVSKDEFKGVRISYPLDPRINEMFLITQTGYLMLVKSFNDDLAWKVQRHLVNRYFEKPGFILDPSTKNRNNINYSLAGLCKNADRYLGGKVSLRVLNHFTGVKVDDFIAEIDIKQREKRPAKHLNDLDAIDFYMHALLDDGPDTWGFSTGIDVHNNLYFVAMTNALVEAFEQIGNAKGLPAFPFSVRQFGARMHFLKSELEKLGWTKTKEKAVGGNRYFRYVFRREEGV